MANPILNAHSDAGKPFPFNFHHSDFYGTRATCSGLIEHPLVSPETQIQLLELMDDTGSSTIGDCIAALPGHPSPVRAVLALADAGLVKIDDGTLSAASRVFRRSEGHGGTSSREPTSLGLHKNPYLSHAAMESIKGSVVYSASFVRKLEGSAFRPEALVFDLKAPLTSTSGVPAPRPCVYFALRENHLTLGTVGDAPPFKLTWDDYDQLVVVLDHSGTMTARQATIAQRILGLSLDELDGYILDSKAPEGLPCTAEEYEQLRIFVTKALLHLRRAGVAFTQIAPSVLMAGPKGAFDILYADDVAADGQELMLDNDALIARATHLPGSWTVQEGSEIRRDLTHSDDATISQLRRELDFSGVIELRGNKSIVTMPLRFASASAAAEFVSGSADHPWVPVGPT